MGTLLIDSSTVSPLGLLVHAGRSQFVENKVEVITPESVQLGPGRAAIPTLDHGRSTRRMYHVLVCCLSSVALLLCCCSAALLLLVRWWLASRDPTMQIGWAIRFVPRRASQRLAARPITGLGPATPLHRFLHRHVELLRPMCSAKHLHLSSPTPSSIDRVQLPITASTCAFPRRRFIQLRYRFAQRCLPPVLLPWHTPGTLSWLGTIQPSSPPAQTEHAAHLISYWIRLMPC